MHSKVAQTRNRACNWHRRDEIIYGLLRRPPAGGRRPPLRNQDGGAYSRPLERIQSSLKIVLR